MQACVIYNPKSGDVYNIIYGMEEIPEGFEGTAMILDIPEGCNLMSLDISEEPPKPNYNYWPAIDLESVKQKVSDNKKMIDDAFDEIGTKSDNDTADLIIEEMVNLTADICNLELGG